MERLRKRRIRRLLVVLAFGVFAFGAACGGEDASPASVRDSETARQTQAQEDGAAQAQAAPERETASEEQEANTDADGTLPETPLKLAFLLDYSGPLAEWAPELQKGFDLAIKQINEAGGVWGMPVESAIGDDGTNPTIAVEEARRLVEIEGVHGIVGPMSSAMTLAITESVTAAARVSVISPVATSSQLTLAQDDDFLFRVSLADRVEGVYLAQLAREQGFDNVALIYRDDAFGQGMAKAFEEHWQGTVETIGIDPAGSSFVSELQQSSRSGAEALVLVAFPPEAILLLREALEQGYFDQFVFSAAGQSLTLPEAIGAEALAGMHGTYVAPAPENDSSRAWVAAYTAEYGAPPTRPYIKEAYDATIALALAAQAAGTNDGAEIRDQLRRIGSGPGRIVIAQAESIAAGLDAAAAGDDIDYEGAAGTLDWDVNGDITRGYIGTWRFTETGEIERVDVFAYVAD